MDADVFRLAVSAIGDITGRDPVSIKEEHRLGPDLKMDRIAKLEMVTVLAEQFQVDVELSEMRRLNTVRDVCQYFIRHR